MKKTFFCGGAVLMLALSCARAELKWDNTALELKPGVGETSVSGKYTFTNAGREPLTIAAIHSTCGCTTAVLEKKTYQPGERGEIPVRFDIGMRAGLQSKQIFVQIEGRKEPVELTLEVDIPEVARVLPPFVVWKHGADPEPKAVVVEALDNYKVRVLRAASSDQRFGLAVEPVEENRRCKVVITPVRTNEHALATLSIEVEVLPEGVRKTFYAYAQVQPQPR